MMSTPAPITAFQLGKSLQSAERRTNRYGWGFGGETAWVVAAIPIETAEHGCQLRRALSFAVRRSEMQVISIGSYLAAATRTAQPDLLYFNHWHVLVAFHNAREIPVIECPEQEPLHDAGGIRFRQLPPPLNRQALF
jgi:hypothetical protein